MFLSINIADFQFKVQRKATPPTFLKCVEPVSHLFPNIWEHLCKILRNYFGFSIYLSVHFSLLLMWYFPWHKLDEVKDNTQWNFQWKWHSHKLVILFGFDGVNTWIRCKAGTTTHQQPFLISIYNRRTRPVESSAEVTTFLSDLVVDFIIAHKSQFQKQLGRFICNTEWTECDCCSFLFITQVNEKITFIFGTCFFQHIWNTLIPGVTKVRGSLLATCDNMILKRAS